jgi:hypothetical protein
MPHYTLRLLDSNRHRIHSLHLDCPIDASAIARVERLSLRHAMELRQGIRIVKRYDGSPSIEDALA